MSDTTILVCFENCADDGSCDQIIAPTLPMDFEDSVITYAPAGFGNATSEDLKQLDEATFLEVFDGADNCFISAYRDEGSAEEIKVHIEYLASPNLEGRTVILVDPMLATGSSLVGGYAALLKNGKPKNLHVACIVAAPEGIAELQNKMPEIDTLWIAAIDSHLNEHAYIVPGLGDAGDRMFGTK
mgnify:CR=1 FL=1